MAEDLTDDIATAATTPKSVKVDDTQTTARDISEMIEADNHAKAGTAARRPHRGIRLSRFQPPGATGA